MRLSLPLLALALLAACTSKVSADLTIDGTRFEPTTCRSGQPSGFAGVDLVDKGGRKLRLVQDPSGQGLAVLFPSGATVGAELGRCGTFTLEQQNSTINDVRNVKGSATLDCDAAGHQVKGKVTFENCH